jgi:YidC/Oxa1 family membrane protein insertase
MYLLFRSASVAGGTNQLLARTIFGTHLGAYWLSGPGALSAQGGIFLGLFAALAACGWVSAKVARKMAAPGPAAASVTPGAGTVKAIAAVAPYITVAFAAFAPLATGIYLVTTMAWATAERWLFLRRRGDPAKGPAQPRGAVI